MSQFCVYTNINSITKSNYPFLLDVQNQILDSIETRLVIPLILSSKYESKPIKELMPLVIINKKEYVILTPLQAGIHKKNLGQFVFDLSLKRQEIINAIDFLLTGF
jgi:toxin CcdB